jgi:hypothetical protein
VGDKVLVQLDHDLGAKQSRRELRIEQLHLGAVDVHPDERALGPARDLVQASRRAPPLDPQASIDAVLCGDAPQAGLFRGKEVEGHDPRVRPQAGKPCGVVAVGRADVEQDVERSAGHLREQRAQLQLVRAQVGREMGHWNPVPHACEGPVEDVAVGLRPDKRVRRDPDRGLNRVACDVARSHLERLE